MARSEQFLDGYRRAARDAVTFLHNTAARMKDPKVRQALDAAASQFGAVAKEKARAVGETDGDG